MLIDTETLNIILKATELPPPEILKNEINSKEDLDKILNNSERLKKFPKGTRFLIIGSSAPIFHKADGVKTNLRTQDIDLILLDENAISDDVKKTLNKNNRVPGKPYLEFLNSFWTDYLAPGWEKRANIVSNDKHQILSASVEDICLCKLEIGRSKDISFVSSLLYNNDIKLETILKLIHHPQINKNKNRIGLIHDNWKMNILAVDTIRKIRINSKRKEEQTKIANEFYATLMASKKQEEDKNNLLLSVAQAMHPSIGLEWFKEKAIIINKDYKDKYEFPKVNLFYQILDLKEKNIKPLKENLLDYFIDFDLTLKEIHETIVFIEQFYYNLIDEDELEEVFKDKLDKPSQKENIYSLAVLEETFLTTKRDHMPKPKLFYSLLDSKSDDKIISENEVVQYAQEYSLTKIEILDLTTNIKNFYRGIINPQKLKKCFKNKSEKIISSDIFELIEIAGGISPHTH